LNRKPAPEDLDLFSGKTALLFFEASKKKCFITRFNACQLGFRRLMESLHIANSIDKKQHNSSSVMPGRKKISCFVLYFDISSGWIFDLGVQIGLELIEY